MVIKTTYFIRLPILNRYINIKSYGEAKYDYLPKEKYSRKRSEIKDLIEKDFHVEPIYNDKFKN